MINTTSSENALAQDNVVDIDHIRMVKLDSAAANSHSGIMSLIKLRQKGAYKVSKLPRDVFRCILEYQMPKVLCWRYSEPYVPILYLQNKHFPTIDKLDYENYVVALSRNDSPKFILRDGTSFNSGFSNN